MPSLSQQYRPRLFADVTGQQAIVSTLQQEIRSDRLSHAYVFAGPRGIGKTTTARIFAKALTCHTPQSGEPCGRCASCLASERGSLLDIIELDAATHTGVDMVREAIIEHVRVGPILGKRKVYILDEAHMLSTASWNALLKTLEEPPAYAFFLFATTEWHKVPMTVLSRCQRFDFRRVDDVSLRKRVQWLAEQQQWNVDERVVDQILTYACGCVRDAETVLGQLGAVGNGTVTMDVSRLVLPERQIARVATWMDGWVHGDVALSIQWVDQAMDEGLSPEACADDVLFIVQMLVAGLGNTSPHHGQQGSEEDRAIGKIVGSIEPTKLANLALLVMERRRDIRAGIDGRFLLQLLAMMAIPLLREPISSRETSCVTGGASNHPALETGASTATLSVSAPVDSASVAHTSEDTIDLLHVRQFWSRFIQAVDAEHHSLSFVLKISQPDRMEGHTLWIRVPYDLHRDALVSNGKRHQIVERCARDVFGDARLRIDAVVGTHSEDGPRTHHATDAVSRIVSAFGGSVVEGVHDACV